MLQYEMVGDLFSENEAHMMPRKRSTSRAGKNVSKSKRSVGSEVCYLIQSYQRSTTTFWPEGNLNLVCRMCEQIVHLLGMITK